MFKWIVNAALFFMCLGITTTVLATDGIDKNQIITEEVITERTIETTNEKPAEHLAQKMSIKQTGTFDAANDQLAEETIAQNISIEETSAPESADEDLPEETVAEEATELEKEETVAEKYAKWHTGILTASKGYITDSPCGPNGNDGYETWYPTYPGGAVKILEKECGFTNLKLEVCKDDGPRKGVRILSGTMPNGEIFENLIVVAADIICERNPTGAFKRGQLIEISLGQGIIVDFCERAVNERKYNGRTHVDIAANW